jgi:hypothetical protein
MTKVEYHGVKKPATPEAMKYGWVKPLVIIAGVGIAVYLLWNWVQGGQAAGTTGGGGVGGGGEQAGQVPVSMPKTPEVGPSTTPGGETPGPGATTIYNYYYPTSGEIPSVGGLTYYPNIGPSSKETLADAGFQKGLGTLGNVLRAGAMMPTPLNPLFNIFGPAVSVWPMGVNIGTTISKWASQQPAVQKFYSGYNALMGVGISKSAAGKTAAAAMPYTYGVSGTYDVSGKRVGG